MTMEINNMNSPNRSQLKFSESIKVFFNFLQDLGFFEIDSCSTYVCYQKNGVELDIYHGRQSYEIGAGVKAFGIRYSIGEIIHHTDPEFAKKYLDRSATTAEGVAISLEKLSLLIQKYCRLALDGDQELFLELEHERTLWAEEYSLDVLAEQLKPEAEAAFRAKNYLKVIELYSHIERRLSPVEMKKLEIAKKRAVK